MSPDPRQLLSADFALDFVKAMEGMYDKNGHLPVSLLLRGIFLDERVPKERIYRLWNTNGFLYLYINRTGFYEQVKQLPEGEFTGSIYGAGFGVPVYEDVGLYP